MKIFTVGFTGKKARHFFETLRSAGVERVVDVRLNNTSQLSGFSKRDDLMYFLDVIGKIDYLHLPQLAPTRDMLDMYKKHRGGWMLYEREFLGLMEERRIEHTLDPGIMDRSCLLCSESEPHHCHRRLVAEYLGHHWPDISIEHLK